MFDLEDVTRHIMGFSKIPDDAGEHPMEVDYEFAWPVSLSFLQELFNIDPNEPDEGARYLISSYKIDKKKAEVLQPFVKEKLDLDKYYFQLECSDKKSYEEWKENEKSGWKLQESDLVRFISAYPHEATEMLEERYEPFKPLPLEFLRKIFPENIEVDNLVGYHDINSKQAKALQPFFKEKLDTKNYDLYLRSLTKDIYNTHYKK